MATRIPADLRERAVAAGHAGMARPEVARARRGEPLADHPPTRAITRARDFVAAIAEREGGPGR